MAEGFLLGILVLAGCVALVNILVPVRNPVEISIEQVNAMLVERQRAMMEYHLAAERQITEMQAHQDQSP